MDDDRRIPLARPYLGTEEWEALRRVLSSRRLTQGPEVQSFEEETRGRLDGAEVVAVSSGGAALLLALKALGVGPGDQVLVPAFTFPAAAQAALWIGAFPIPVDVEENTLAPSPETIDREIRVRRPAAVVVAHAFGIPADIEEIARVCRSQGVPLVEDAACSIGGRTPGGAPSGTVGDVGVFSLHPRKNLVAGEGGAVTSRHPEVVRRVRSMRDYGRTPTGTEDAFGEEGLNFRLSELAAAVARVQWTRVEDGIRARGMLARVYREALREVSGVRWVGGYDRSGQTWQTLVVRLDRSAAEVRRRLAEQGVEAGVAAHALTLQTFWRRRFPEAPPCPTAEALARQALALPLYVEMASFQVRQVVRHLAEAMGPATPPTEADRWRK